LGEQKFARLLASNFPRFSKKFCFDKNALA
jgi:hypothetical protein